MSDPWAIQEFSHHTWAVSTFGSTDMGPGAPSLALLQLRRLVLSRRPGSSISTSTDHRTDVWSGPTVASPPLRARTLVRHERPRMGFPRDEDVVEPRGIGTASSTSRPRWSLLSTSGVRVASIT